METSISAPCGLTPSWAAVDIVWMRKPKFWINIYNLELITKADNLSKVNENVSNRIKMKRHAVFVQFIILHCKFRTTA